MDIKLNEVPEVRQNLAVKDSHFRLLIESVEDYAIFLLDTTGHILSWNKGAEKLKQYKPDEIIGQHFSVFYTPDAIARNYPAEELEQALKLGRWEDEGWRIRKDGSTFWANVILTPLFQNGIHLGFSKVTRNLTERKKAEDDLYKAFQDLKESEERYRRLIEGVGDYAIFMLDPAGNVATWNEGARRIKGYEAHEILGKPFSRFYRQQDRVTGGPEEELKEATQTGRYEEVGWRVRKDGTAFWANVVLTAIRNPAGELLGFSKITRDITDRKQLEEQLFRANEELKESEEKTSLLIDSMKDYAILMLNQSGEITSWNVGAERIKGYSAKEIIGKHFSVFYSREAIAQGFPQYELERALADGRFEDEGWRIRKDGTAFWANVVITAIFNSAGRHLGFSKITRDMTEKRRNEELMHKNQELLRLNRDLDNFVYSASHDLKAPILNLEGLVTELKQEMGTEQKKYVDILPWIDDTLHSLKKVVEDLGEITRIEQPVLKPEQVNLAGMMLEIKDSLRDQIQVKQVRITEDFSAFPTLAYSRKNLRSVLFNLVSNAIKYSADDKNPEVKVTTRYLWEEKAVELTVSDNGLGIPETQKDKIFSMFRRLHTHVEGSGIGLYLVKKILDNQGDRIQVESQVDVGSTFRVWFFDKS